MKSAIYNNLPSVVKTILLVSEGWLVGGAVRQLAVGVIPKDFDIIVPDSQKFQTTVKVITNAMNTSKWQLKFNTFGGFKFSLQEHPNEREYLIDIWPETVDHFIANSAKVDLLYQLNGSRIIQVY